MNAELFARAPDNVRLLLSVLEDEPVGCDDFYCRCVCVWGGAVLYVVPQIVWGLKHPHWLAVWA